MYLKIQITWKFNRKGGLSGAVSAVKADKASFDSIRHAISYALSGTRKGRIEYVVLHLLDDSGDSWVIERGAIDTDYLKIDRLWMMSFKRHLWVRCWI